MRSWSSIRGMMATLAVSLPMLVLAAPPGNDAFDSPVVVGGFPANSTGTNVDATLEANEPKPNTWAGAGEASVWFRWTSPTSGPVQIDTLGSSFDTMLAVWTGDHLTNLTLLAENDQYSGDQSAVFIAAVSGVTYQIGVYGWYEARGSITLNITNDVTSHISGTVTGPDGTTPLQGIQATAYRWSGSWWDQVSSDDTDASGSYSIGELPAGTYRVEFQDWQNGDYITEVYDDAADLDSGTDIVVPAETTVTGIDASLANASRISGTVTGPDGTTPLQGIQATAYRWSGSWWDQVSSDDTDASGSYSIGELPAGTYRVEFQDWQNGDYITEVYDDAADLDSGTDIVVPAETTVTGIDASLANASRISGTVTGPDGTTPLQGIQATAYRWSGSWWDWVSSDDTDASGSYSIGGLAAGTYRVEFQDWQNGDYITEVYDDAADLDSGTDIVVPAETTVTGIDASLANASRISGTVTGPDGTTPLQGIQATAYRWSGSWWDWVSSDDTDASGSYSIGGLPAGTYRVEFQDWQNGDYITAVYDDAADLDSGTDIVVPAETTVTGIDASLASIMPSEPPRIVALRKVGGDEWEIKYVGTSGQEYILQEVSSLTNSWADVEASFLCQPGTNTISRQSSAYTLFWRLREYP